jgi:phosphonate transport system substrate-binding protein
MTDTIMPDDRPDTNGVLRVAIGAMISPKETEKSYYELLRLAGRHIGREVQFYQRKTYAEVNSLLQNREIDLAYVCSGPYVEGHKTFGMQLLAVPVVHGEPVYHSYFIVHMESSIKNLEQLRSRRFAFVDPDSNTGYLVPVYYLSKRGENPQKFFREIFFTHSHDNSIKAVANGLADGAAVDSLIWEYVNATNPQDTSRTRIIEKSPPYGIPPMVVHPGINPELKQQLREVFLHLHEDPDAVSLLKNIQIDRFITGRDAMYESVRKMQQELYEKQ